MSKISNFNFIDEKRSFIMLMGRDAFSFLNGLITNDMAYLEVSDRLMYTCLLTAQGKYESDFFIFKFNGNFIIDCLQSHLDILLQKFKIFKLRADIIVTDVSQSWCVYLSSALPESMAPTPSSIILTDPRHPELGYRCYIHYSEAQTVLPTLDNNDVNQYMLLRMQLGIPSYPASLIPNKTVPLEANMDEMKAIAWDKGCYLGQELTARTKYRGLVNKRYLPVIIEQGTAEIGWDIFYKEEKIGKLLEVYQNLGIARLSIDIVTQVIKRNDSIDQKYCQLKPSIPSWLKLY